MNFDLTNPFSAAAGAAQGAAEAVAHPNQAIDNAQESVTSKVEDAKDFGAGAIDSAQNVGEDVVGFKNDTVNGVENFAQDASEMPGNAVDSVRGSVSDAGQGVALAGGSWLGGMSDRLNEAGGKEQDSPSKEKDVPSHTHSGGAQDAAQGGLDQVNDKSPGSPGFMENLLSGKGAIASLGAGTGLGGILGGQEKAGVDAPEQGGLLGGISEMAGNVRDGASDMAGTAVDGAKDLANKADGPAQVGGLAGAAQWVGQKVDDLGIDDAFRAIVRKGDEMGVDEAYHAVKKPVLSAIGSAGDMAQKGLDGLTQSMDSPQQESGHSR